MSIAVSCECGGRYSVKDELAGKRIKCPKCGAATTVPMPVAVDDDPLNLASLAALENSASSLPRSAPSTSSVAADTGSHSGGTRGRGGRKKSSDAADEFNPYAAPVHSGGRSTSRSSSSGLLRVAGGLNLVYWGIAIVLLSVISGAVLGAAIASSNENVTADDYAESGLVAILGFGVIIGGVLAMLGKVMCLSVPRKTQATELIVGSIVFDVAAVGVRIVQMSADLPPIARSLTGLFSLLGTLCFILFLKRIAEYLGQGEMADRAQSLIGLGAFLFCATLGSGFVILVAPALGALVILAAAVLAIFMFLRYVRLLTDLRGAILGRR